MKLDLIILSIAPTLALIFWVTLKDKYEKEPINFLIKVFLVGCLISIPAIIIESILIEASNLVGVANEFYLSFIVAGATEEILKSLVLIFYVIKNKNFNERLDGIIYSILVSLGFATVENILYVVFGDGVEAIHTGVSRALISVPAHMLFAITMGYYISLYIFSNKTKDKKRWYLIKSICVPVLLHGVFDFILMVRIKWAMVIFIGYTIYLWKINLDKLDEYTENSRKRFEKRNLIFRNKK